MTDTEIKAVALLRILGRCRAEGEKRADVAEYCVARLKLIADDIVAELPPEMMETTGGDS
jgi:hypothetical protein